MMSGGRLGAAWRRPPWNGTQQRASCELAQRFGRALRQSHDLPGARAQVAAEDVRASWSARSTSSRRSPMRSTRGRLHHAYLLTGTRGVGKTTIARILAKSLNCVTGVTPRPAACAPRAPTSTPAASSTCSSSTPRRTPASTTCARSSTTRATRRRSGRYKVYLIDEVHMLSKAAFNSMLKTLEEPPEHVQVRARDDRSAEDPGHRAVALPAVQPEAAAAAADRRAHRVRSSPRRASRTSAARSR